MVPALPAAPSSTEHQMKSFLGNVYINCNSARWWENRARLRCQTFAAHTGRYAMLHTCLCFSCFVLFGVLTSFDNTDYNLITPFRLAWHVSSSSAAFRANGPAGVLSFCACIPAVFPLVQLFPFFQKSSFTVLLFGRVSLTSSNC